MKRFAIVLVLLASLASCSRDLDESTPEGALALFLDALQRSEDDRAALEDAYGRLDSTTQRRLSDRARSATALGAREYQPWEMLVEGRALVRFQPRRGNGLRAREGASADEAIVVVTGDDESQRAEIPMRREDGTWRVVLDVPEARGAPPAE